MVNLERFTAMVRNKISAKSILAYTIIKANNIWYQRRGIEQYLNTILNSINHNLELDRVTASVAVVLHYTAPLNRDGTECCGRFRRTIDGNNLIIVYACDSNKVVYSGTHVFETFVHEVVHWIDFVYFDEPVGETEMHDSEFYTRCDILSKRLKGEI